MLQVLLERAPRMTCRYTGAELIMVPSFSYKRTHEQHNETKKTRKVESEQTVKKVKVVKEVQAEPQQDADEENAGANKGNGAAKGKGKGAQVKPATDAQLKRLEKIIAKLDSTKLHHAQAMLEIDTKKAHAWIPMKLTDQINAYKSKLDTTHTMAAKFFADKQFSPDDFKALLEDCKAVGAPFLECIAQSETLVGMATKVGQ